VPAGSPQLRLGTVLDQHRHVVADGFAIEQVTFLPDDVLDERARAMTWETA
jgi:hypothetical protein